MVLKGEIQSENTGAEIQDEEQQVLNNHRSTTINHRSEVIP